MCENVYKDEINIVDSYSFSIMVFFHQQGDHPYEIS